MAEDVSDIPHDIEIEVTGNDESYTDPNPNVDWFSQLNQGTSANTPNLPAGMDNGIGLDGMPVSLPKYSTENGRIFDLKDTALSIANAPHDAVNSMMDLSYSTGHFAKEVWDKGFSEAEYKELKAPYRLPEYESQTVVGALANDLTQWATGFGILTGVTKGAKAVTGINQLARTVRTGAPVGTSISEAVGTGARQMAADTVFMEREEERLGNLFERFPLLQDTFLTYTAHREGDTVADNFLKTSLEGLGLGAVSSILGKIFKYHKLVRNGASDDAVYKAVKDINDAVANPQRGPVAPYLHGDKLLPPEEIDKMIAGASREEAPLAGFQNGVNLDRIIFETPEGSHVLGQLSEAQVKNMLRTKGPQTHEQLLEKCFDDLDGMGLNYRDQMSRGKAALKNMQEALKVASETRATVYNLTDLAMSYARRIATGTSTPLDRARYLLLSKNLQEFLVLNADMGTTAGRILESRKAVIDGEKALKMAGASDPDARAKNWFQTADLTEANALDYLRQAGMDDAQIIDAARAQLACGSRVGEVQLLQQIKPGFSLFDVALELRVNGMLSSPITSAVNTFSSGFNLLLKPGEKMIGGIAEGVATGDWTTVKKAAHIYQGYASFTVDALRMTGKALRLGDGILDVSGSKVEMLPQHITYERIRNSLLRNRPAGSELGPIEEQMARAVGWIGTVIRIPTRLMMGTDEFYKQLAFRSHLRASLIERGERQGLSGNTLNEYVRQNFDESFRPGGAVARGELTADSLQFAREVTWTEDLTGTMGKAVQHMLQEAPQLRLILPFHKTPTNLFYDTLRHVPYLAPGSKEWSDMWKAFREGGEARADVLGRISTGAMIMGLAYHLVSEGLVTGAPPENPKERALWLANKIKPYSLKIGDEWVEYRRFDPAAMLLGTCADVYNALADSEDTTDSKGDMAEQAIWAAFISIITNLKDKTYMQGVSEIVEAVNNPDSRLVSYAGRMSSTFLPYSGLLRFHRNQWGDPVQREMENYTDYLKNTSSFFSKDLPARYSWLTGEQEATTAGLRQKRGDDPVLQELLRLGPAITGKPSARVRGVEIDKRLYSRLCELHGTVKLGGRTMHETLRALFDSPGYDIKREHLKDGIYGQDTPRTQAVNKIIDAYRQVAEAMLIRENPELWEQIKEVYIENRASKAGALSNESSDGLPTKQDRLRQLIQ